MKIILPSNSLLSSLLALSLRNSCDCEITIKNENFKSFGRFYSLNYFSKNFLDSISLWQLLDKSKITPYKKIEIYKNTNKTIEFDISDVGIDYLGYIINEDDLVKTISKKLFENREIKKSEKLILSEEKNDLNIISNYGDICSSKDLINFSLKEYSQTAINITLQHSEDNMRIPKQIFYQDEILGFLPLDNNSYNLIWSMPNHTFDKIGSSNSKEYITLIESRIGSLFGDIKDIQIGNTFPLYSRHASQYYYNNCLLIGDSAHKFHPLAGLGLNMGIEDISVLTTLISSNHSIKKIMNEYCIKRMNRNHSLQNLLDIIISFHSSKIIPRDYQIKILKLFNKTFFLKPNIISNATGLNNYIYSNNR